MGEFVKKKTEKNRRGAVRDTALTKSTQECVRPIDKRSVLKHNMQYTSKNSYRDFDRSADGWRCQENPGNVCGALGRAPAETHPDPIDRCAFPQYDAQYAFWEAHSSQSGSFPALRQRALTAVQHSAR